MILDLVVGSEVAVVSSRCRGRVRAAREIRGLADWLGGGW